MIHYNKGVTGLRHGQPFIAQVEGRKTGMRKIKLVDFLLQTLEDEIVVAMRHFQTRLNSFRALGSGF